MADPDGITPEALSQYAEILKLSYTNLIVCRALYTAAELRIPDLLGTGPATAQDLARRAQVNPDALGRLLGVLSRAGVCTTSDDHLFSLTPMGMGLRSDIAGSLRDWVLFSGSDFYLRAWLELPYCIRTGKPAWERAHGSPFFDYLGNRPEDQAVFDAALTSLSAPEARAVVAAYDFSPFRNVLDVGGGHGTLVAAILKAYTHLRAGIFEQPQVLEAARFTMQQAGLSDRCDFIEGSFFESLPNRYDAYLLKYIVHDWSDEKAKAILRICRSAMAKTSKLLLIEMVNSWASATDLRAVSDLEMLVLLGERERSSEEFASLLAEAGFLLNRIIATRSPLSVLEALPM